jgi:hypothetical protein
MSPARLRSHVDFDEVPEGYGAMADRGVDKGDDRALTV